MSREHMVKTHAFFYGNMCLAMKRGQTDALGVPDSSFCTESCGEEDGKGPRRRYRIWQVMRVRRGSKIVGIPHGSGSGE